MKTILIILYCTALFNILLSEGKTDDHTELIAKEVGEYGTNLPNFLGEILENIQEQMPDGIQETEVITETTDDDTVVTGKEADEYDTKLSNFIREILENFREQMPEGMPEIGVPPVDPLVIPNIDEHITEGVANVDLQMRDLNITGISKFRIEELKADLEKGFANFSFSVPELMADGHCYMNGKILNIFPINSDGPFFIRVTEVQMKGYGDLNVTSNGGQTRLHMNDLKLHLTFGPLKIEFKSLLGGGRWTKMLLKLLTGLGRQLFFHFHREAMAKLDKALLKIINKELDKGTLAEFLDKIPII